MYSLISTKYIVVSAMYFNTTINAHLSTYVDCFDLPVYVQAQLSRVQLNIEPVLK